MQDGMMMGGPMMLIGVLTMVLVLVAVIAGTVWLVRTLSREQPGPRRDAVDQLDLRYAGGAIDRDEYLQRRDDMRSASEPHRAFRGGG